VLLLLGATETTAAASGYISNYYPTAALKAGEQGTVWYRVDVTPEGKTQNCVIVQSSGSASLDQTTCAIILARVHFKPRLDADGKPLPLPPTYTNKIEWKLPQ
jgi:protein TonB